ncbi:MAG: flagellar basal body-associated FliL family protein [Desulfobacteraceae bacterium]|nr:flagellar basal body-associated FliL family protein [Desulfobacteraceae bacterium]
MTRFQFAFSCVFLVLFMAFPLTGCGEKEKGEEDLVLGNWTQYRNRAYILLIISPQGNWNSSVRIADATSKIVKSKGNAQGTWHMEEGQLIFTVTDSNIEEIWEKNDTSFFEIVELGERIMLLKEENGRVAEWKKTNVQKSKDSEAVPAVVIAMKPIAVNLNKNRSNTQDRYLCLNMNMVIKELMPDQQIPIMHPKAREAAVLFLSSLVYEDIKDFDRLEIQKLKLVDALNPYMDGFIKDIEIEHVIVSTTIEKVEEFLIEHTMGLEKEVEEVNGEKQAEPKVSEGEN